MTRFHDEYDPSCLACGVGRTMNGHLCAECNRKRYGTIHPRWNDLDYAASCRLEVVAMDKRNATQYASKKRTEERREAA